MSTTLEETRLVVQEAINVFHPQHDVEQVRSFKKTSGELGAVRHQQQLALKSLIKGFSPLAFSKFRKEKKRREEEEKGKREIILTVTFGFHFLMASRADHEHPDHGEED